MPLDGGGASVGDGGVCIHVCRGRPCRKTKIQALRRSRGRTLCAPCYCVRETQTASRQPLLRTISRQSSSREWGVSPCIRDSSSWAATWPVLC